MRMVRFKSNIIDGQELIWQKGNIYQILYENQEAIWLNHDAINNESYAIAKSDLNSYCFIYNCNGNINVNCQYCKALSYNGEQQYCAISKGDG